MTRRARCIVGSTCRYPAGTNPLCCGMDHYVMGERERNLRGNFGENEHPKRAASSSTNNNLPFWALERAKSTLDEDVHK